MNTPALSNQPIWEADYVGPSLKAAALSPSCINAQWRPLIQHWSSGGPDPAFQPGWARIRWHENYLRYEAIFVGGGAHNRARRLNEPTWELGDVCEIFLQVPSRPFYLELHVTPENQRLQLHWTLDGLDKVAHGAARLEDFMIGDLNWAQSSTHIAPTYWVAQTTIPLEHFWPGETSLAAATELLTAVCRYDYGPRTDPVHSSTAALGALKFHRRQDWQKLSLRPKSR